MDFRGIYARTMIVLRALERREAAGDIRRKISRGGRSSAGIPPVRPSLPAGGGGLPVGFGPGEGAARGGSDGNGSGSRGGVLMNAASMVARGSILGPGSQRTRRPLEAGAARGDRGGRSRGSFYLPGDITPGPGGITPGGGGFDVGNRTGSGSVVVPH